MKKVWVACIEFGHNDVKLFSTAEKAYEYLLEIIRDNALIEDLDNRFYWEKIEEELTADYNRDNEEFGCDYCWARAEEVS